MFPHDAALSREGLEAEIMLGRCDLEFEFNPQLSGGQSSSDPILLMKEMTITSIQFVVDKFDSILQRGAKGGNCSGVIENQVSLFAASADQADIRLSNNELLVDHSASLGTQF